MIVNRKTFFELQSIFHYVPFNQTEAWLNSLDLNKGEACFFVDSIDKPMCCCWGRVFKRRFIGKHLTIDGISIQTGATSEVIKYFYKEIVSEEFYLIELSDINIYDANYEVGIRRAGFLRPLRSSLSPLTLIINLQEPFKFHRNWRRNVKKSLNQGDRFIFINKPTINHAEIFVKLFDELKVRKKLGFNLTPIGLMHLFKDERFKLFFVQGIDSKYMAGRIVYYCSDSAYDIFAANSAVANKFGSAYFLQEKIFHYSKNIGINSFDYGRISPGIDQMDDIYISKSFSGGIPVLYNGQWQFSKSMLFDYGYSIYKFYIRQQKYF